ncbi:hypothetical protein [Saccharopolyspora karakumensis]|uniref:hypothetical protein n=1 Tax=Saccharopolyspora karakumensis TaxID=2530386 RepID=UPI0014051613|nr:hypothetical protein [Saccharopolyspora karakumensis]
MNSAMVIALVAAVLVVVFLMTVRTAMSKSNRIDGRRRKRTGGSFVGITSSHDGGWGGFDGGGSGGDGGGGSGGGDGGGGGGGC